MKSDTTRDTHTPHVIELSPAEISASLADSLAAILQLRNEMYYAHRPAYDENHADDLLYAWAGFAERLMETANRMGGHLASAERLQAALHRWIVSQESGMEPQETMR